MIGEFLIELLDQKFDRLPKGCRIGCLTVASALVLAWCAYIWLS